MSKVKSMLTPLVPLWDERIRKMREDYEAKCWDYLFFKIWMNIIDAAENMDYAREELLHELHIAYLYDRESIESVLERLERL